MEQFKQKHPNYFQNYYQNNIHKFKARNDTRDIDKKWNYIIEINGKNYAFQHKKDIKIKKIKKQDLTDIHYILVQ